MRGRAGRPGRSGTRHARPVGTYVAKYPSPSRWTPTSLELDLILGAPGIGPAYDGGSRCSADDGRGIVDGESIEQSGSQHAREDLGAPFDHQFSDPQIEEDREETAQVDPGLAGDDGPYRERGRPESRARRLR